MTTLLSETSNCVELINITKTFGSVVANNQVNFSVKKGEIHALLGENGSGKTTLMNMLSGIYQPNSGDIKLFGEVVNGYTPSKFIELGIGMIYQHFKLVDVMTAQENILLGLPGNLFLNKKKQSDDMRQLSNKFGLNVNLEKKIYQMSVSEKQNVEILKVLFRGAKILILDEPTAVLTPQETKKLFQILRNMKENGCSVIIITHKLHEVMEISDRVTVLRKGESIATLVTSETSSKELTEQMVGRPISLSIERKIQNKGRKLLQVTDLTILNDEKVKALDSVSFDLFQGEILGVAGIAGSGQKELCEAIAGMQKIKSGQMVFKEVSLNGKSPRDIFKMGISMSFIPEDRLGMGLVASMNMIDNVILKSYQKQKGIYLNRKPARHLSEKLIEGLEIKTPGVHHPVRLLSGGNVQKVLLGREIESNPELLITAYPVRGLDINASYKIYDLLNQQKEKGVGILFVGEDLDVLLEISDRIMVLCQGRVVGIVEAAKADKEMIGYMMTGGQILDEVSIC